MSLETRRDLVVRWRKEYASSRKVQKGQILDLLCKETGWNRKHAMAALKELPSSQPKQTRKRKRRYGLMEEAALVKVWKLSDYLASKRLAPFMEEFVLVLERHGELSLTEPTRSRLIKMSASTIDRLLKRHRASHPRSFSSTRPGSLLKKEVAVRMGNGWQEDVPGYCEVDTVAHCGGSLEGEFFWTLSLTDVATGWTECAPLRSRGQQEALRQLQTIRSRLPFKLLGLDSDNGGEFMNWHLVKFCQENEIQLTRCRPYHKNDQCRIEQKNSSVVRRHTGYSRYETDNQFRLLLRIHGLLRLVVNFFEPSAKAKQKAMTPYRRLLQWQTLDPPTKTELEATYLALNPVTLRNELYNAKMELYDMQAMVRFLNDASS